jgi:hypothetical protein
MIELQAALGRLTMRTHVSFQKASQTLSDDEQPFGRDVAEPLARSLEQRGLGPIVLDESDYAFAFSCKIGGRAFDVKVGLVDDGVRQWLVTSDSMLGCVRRLFGAKDDEEHLRLLKAIDDILRSDPGVSSIRWYTLDAWNKSPENDWAESPGE